MKMKLTTKTVPRLVTPSEAVKYVADCAERLCDETQERMRARAEAVEQMLGRLIEALTANGQLRAPQLERIFDYSITAEDPRDTP